MALTDPGEVETSDEVTSMHGCRDDLVLGERIRGNSGSKRKQDGRWVVPLGESEAVHMGSVGTKGGEQNDEVIERGGK